MTVAEQALKQALEDKVRLLAILSDIHAHLAAGKTIAPDNKSVLNEREDFSRAPTLTEVIGGMLREMGAAEFLKANSGR